MRQLSSIEIHVIIDELKSLVRARVDKIGSLEDGIVIQFYVTSSGKKQLLIKPPKYITLGSAAAGQSSEFCMALRKHLEGARLVSMSQMKMERIMEFHFSHDITLIAEMFSKGNLMLTDSTGKILSCWQNQQWGSRQLRPGLKYEPPKGAGEMSEEAIYSMIAASGKDSLVKAIAMDIGVGGLYSEETCLECGVDKLQKPASISRDEASKITACIGRMLAEQPKPLMVYKDSKLIDVIPFSLKYYSSEELRPASSFSEAIVQVVESQAPKPNKRIDSLRAIINQQQEQIATLKQDIEENTAKAELIYTNYQVISGILQELAAIKEKQGLRQAMLHAKSLGLEINEKEGTVAVELEK